MSDESKEVERRGQSARPPQLAGPQAPLRRRTGRRLERDDHGGGAAGDDVAACGRGVVLDGPADPGLPAGRCPDQTAIPVARNQPLNEDFRDGLSEFLSAQARFLVVGAHAVAVHGIPRATGDLALWIDPDEENGTRVWTVLVRFGGKPRNHHAGSRGSGNDHPDRLATAPYRRHDQRDGARLRGSMGRPGDTRAGSPLDTLPRQSRIAQKQAGDRSAEGSGRHPCA